MLSSFSSGSCFWIFLFVFPRARNRLGCLPSLGSAVGWLLAGSWTIGPPMHALTGWLVRKSASLPRSGCRRQDSTAWKEGEFRDSTQGSCMATRASDDASCTVSLSYCSTLFLSVEPCMGGLALYTVGLPHSHNNVKVTLGRSGGQDHGNPLPCRQGCLRSSLVSWTTKLAAHDLRAMECGLAPGGGGHVELSTSETSQSDWLNWVPPTPRRR